MLQVHQVMCGFLTTCLGQMIEAVELYHDDMSLWSPCSAQLLAAAAVAQSLCKQQLV